MLIIRSNVRLQSKEFPVKWNILLARRKNTPNKSF